MKQTILEGLKRAKRVPAPRRVPAALLLQAQDNLYLGAIVALLLAFTLGISDSVLGHFDTPGNGLALSLWITGIGFAIAGRFTLRERISGRSQVVTAPEMVLIPALFGSRPVSVVLAAFVGTLIGAGTGRWKTSGWGLLLQAALASCEAAVVLAVVRSSVDQLFVAHTSTWLITIAVMVGVRLLRVLVTIGAVAFSGTRVQRNDVIPTIAVALTSCLGFASIALVATIVATQSRAAIVLIVVNVAVLMLTYRAFIVLRERHARLRLLHDFATGLTRSVALEDVIRSTLAQASTVLRVEGAELTLFDGEIAVRHAYGSADEAAPIPSTSDWLWRSALSQGRTVLCTGAQRQEIEYLATVGARDAMATPLLHGSDLLGILAVRNRLPELLPFGPGERELFTTMAEQASVAIHAAQLERQLRRDEEDRIRAANVDTLTGLANRSALTDRIDDYVRTLPNDAPTSGALITLDLNRFKDVNSVLGHEVGDALVVAVSKRVLSAVPSSAMVARLGGDELAVLFEDITDLAGAHAAAVAVRDAVDAQHQIGELIVRTDAAIGVAVIPEHGRCHVELMRRAEVAMYQAKQRRESAIEFFDLDQEELSNRKLELLGDLRDAITERKLAVYYQPKASLANGALFGAEALLRWIHPLHGFIAPDEFIALAEHGGLVHDLTAFVLEESLRQCAVWRSQGLTIHVAVNLSARSLREPGFPGEVASALQHAGIDASTLTLEITEGEIVNDAPIVKQTINDLRALGVQIAIDDFGTGYSSLSYIARLSADEVKIDKCFVTGIVGDDVAQAIVRAVVELADRVGMRTVAEGVEDEATWELLRHLGVEIAQGYFLSRPVPGETLGMWLWERRRSGLLVGAELAPNDGGNAPTGAPTKAPTSAPTLIVLPDEQPSLSS